MSALSRTKSATLSMLAATLLMGLVGCATDRLDAAPAAGVNLSGDWQLNPNLSDDPQHPLQDDNASPGNMRHRSGRGRGGGGLPSFGMPGGAGGRTGDTQPDGTEDLTNNLRDSGEYVPTLWQFPGPGGGQNGPATDGAAGTSANGASGARAHSNRFGHWLDAPDHLTIRQDGGKLTIQSKSSGGEWRTEEITPGRKSDLAFGQGTAERTAGWRGTLFVITTQVKDGPTKEDDYALDDEGHLIVSTLMTGGHLPKVDIKRVYDRVKAAQGVRP